jgi:hypothetical protein
MARIKSTLEIALERAEALGSSRKDLERAEQEEMEGKARGWLLELKEKRAEASELEDRLEPLPADRRPVMRRMLLRAALEAINPAGGNEVVFDLWRRLAPAELKRRIESVQPLLDLGRQAIRDLVAKVLAEARAELAQAGISGSAVEPNVWVLPGFSDRLLDVEKEQSRRLQSFRRNLDAALD